MHQNIVWHPQVLSPDTQATLVALSGHRALREFYLAGGTALALQSGHRTSVDLDLFSSGTVNEDVLLGMLQDIRGITLVSKSPETLHLHVGPTKVRFFGYHYPLLFPFNVYEGIKVADPRDIAAMKVSAVASRGTKRDFVDLYILAQQYGLDETIRCFEQKFSQVGLNDVHLMKSLTYFADADKEPMPHMLQPVAWEEVKQFFIAKAPRLRSSS
jgi:predicted nucleotidyltransferase component of viral defense system